MAGALFGEHGNLTFLQIERLELVHLESQHLEARFTIARLALKFHGSIDERDPDLVGLAHAGGELQILAEFIEPLALRTAPRQRLEIMLAVNVDNQ